MPSRSASPFCPALGRELAWDPYGIYPLDADCPLTKAGAEIVKDLQEAELGRAELLARYRLKVDKDDLVPAWALGQIVRARKAALKEYLQMRVQLAKPASETVLFYRFHVCRLASLEVRDDRRPASRERYKEIENNLVLLRDRCRPFGSQRLGFAIGLSQSRIAWADVNRDVLAAYGRSHPRGPDVRPLLCRAFVSGTLYFMDGKPLNDPHLPQAPVPEACLEITKGMLEERPDDPFGLYYAGRAHFMLGKKDLAMKEIKAALDGKRLPEAFQQVARTFLNHPSESAFHPAPPTD